MNRGYSVPPLNSNSFIPQTTVLHPYKNIRELRINPESLCFCPPETAKGSAMVLKEWEFEMASTGKECRNYTKEILCYVLGGVE